MDARYCRALGRKRENIALISTWDGAKSTWDVDGGWMKARGFDFSPDDYFCAGLTFFNLKYFREHDLSRRCLELLALKPPFNDQTVLYLATKGKTKLVPLCWQRIHHYGTASLLLSLVVMNMAEFTIFFRCQAAAVSYGALYSSWRFLKADE